MSSLLSETYNTRFIKANGRDTVTIRSEQIDKCSKEDIEKLKELGILAVVDLRRIQNEIVNPYLKEFGIEYYNIPIDDIDFDLSKFIDDTGAGNDPSKRNVAVGDFYYYSFKQLYRKQMIDVLKVYNRYDGHILIHCSYGKDRTGMIAYLIQKHLGASLEEMKEDYIASAINLKPMFLDDIHRVTTEKSLAIWDRMHELIKGQEDSIFSEFEEILRNKVM